ncbi:MAG: hypothetical protein OEY88_07360 [Candidatus Bathyarchaeota archaeon]|nr:hypothetical protein [Candidatus Bathyarchaeota archaeon]
MIQHVVVSVSFFYNNSDIRSTVAVQYEVLMISGAIVAVLFAAALWGVIERRNWGLLLVAVLAAFDIVGEFIAQGTIFITITVSILVAIVLLVLCYYKIRSIQGKNH